MAEEHHVFKFQVAVKYSLYSAVMLHRSALLKPRLQHIYRKSIISNSNQGLTGLIFSAVTSVQPLSVMARATENKSVRMWCSSDATISVHGACFGVGFCQLEVTDVVRSFCLGRSNCTVPASNEIFGDPCLGEVKYLIVFYEC